MVDVVDVDDVDVGREGPSAGFGVWKSHCGYVDPVLCL